MIIYFSYRSGISSNLQHTNFVAWALRTLTLFYIHSNECNILATKPKSLPKSTKLLSQCSEQFLTRLWCTKEYDYFYFFPALSAETKDSLFAHLWSSISSILLLLPLLLFDHSHWHNDVQMHVSMSICMTSPELNAECKLLMYLEFIQPKGCLLVLPSSSPNSS